MKVEKIYLMEDIGLEEDVDPEVMQEIESALNQLIDIGLLNRQQKDEKIKEFEKKYENSRVSGGEARRKQLQDAENFVKEINKACRQIETKVVEIVKEQTGTAPAPEEVPELVKNLSNNSNIAGNGNTVTQNINNGISSQDLVQILNAFANKGVTPQAVAQAQDNIESGNNGEGQDVKSKTADTEPIRKKFIKPDNDANIALSEFLSNKLKLSKAAEIVKRFDSKKLKGWMGAFHIENLNSGTPFLKLLNDSRANHLIGNNWETFTKFYNAIDDNKKRSNLLNSQILFYPPLYSIIEQEDINNLVGYELENNLNGDSLNKFKKAIKKDKAYNPYIEGVLSKNIKAAASNISKEVKRHDESQLTHIRDEFGKILKKYGFGDNSINSLNAMFTNGNNN